MLISRVGGILIIGGHEELLASRERDILVVGGVTSTDLRALGIKSNSERTAGHDLLSLTGIVDDALVVL